MADALWPHWHSFRRIVSFSTSEPTRASGRVPRSRRHQPVLCQRSSTYPETPCEETRSFASVSAGQAVFRPEHSPCCTGREVTVFRWTRPPQDEASQQSKTFSSWQKTGVRDEDKRSMS
ncbi:hypothetical protein CSUI_002315 [Cystoisospora suis]|uniref:Uncharacterized protein n=1 Tax=Cystoisospora suis TaxID=483139 RepID=A0A2C6L9C4_9APIC|nr:hypothetical protein CSUI_002315 [Cystoisospora suis]